MVTGIILAAGQSRRMGKTNKLTKIWNGKPLVRHVFEAARTSNLDNVIVVSGYEPAKIEALLAGAKIVHNPDFQTGMAGSISIGVEAVGRETGVMILLGDMPLITACYINNLLDRFNENPDSIVVATCNGVQGNPVLFGRNYFEALRTLEGDQGARRLIEISPNITKVEIGEAGARDFDTREAFES